MRNVIFLCGMPGSGKSTLGRKIANKLGWAFTDLDQEIEIQSGKSPAEWLRNFEEERFRIEESRVLKSMNYSDKHIVACGGGTPCFEDNLNWMQQNGICIYIEMPLVSLSQRLIQSKGANQRPLLQDNIKENLEILWMKREAYFKQISWKVNGLTVQPQELATEILNTLRV